jgi:thioredoxin 1
MSALADSSPPLLVSCLCAAWCRACEQYRATFDALAAEFEGRARFSWVDIEDDEAALGDVDVVDFPTLLVARSDDVLFFGPVMPHAQTTRQLVERAASGELPVVTDEALRGLPERLRALR